MNNAFVARPWAVDGAATVTGARAQDTEFTTAAQASEGTDASARTEEISRLFREHNSALLKFVLTRVRNEQEARDIAQETYVRLLQLDRPVVVSYLRWYLFKIARNIAADHYRHARIRTRFSGLDTFEVLDASSPTEAGVIAADELATLREALTELSRNCRDAFFLHRFDGLSTTEVAKRMHITDRMVRNHVRKALLYCRFRCDGFSKEEAMRLASS